MRATGLLKRELPFRLDFRLEIVLEYGAVTKEQDWLAIRHALKSWIINEAQRLENGCHVLGDITGVPFRLHVTKASDRRPGVFFARFEPTDDTLPARIRSNSSERPRNLRNTKV